MRGNATWSAFSVVDSGDDNCWTLIESPPKSEPQFFSPSSPSESAGQWTGLPKIRHDEAVSLVAESGHVAKKNTSGSLNFGGPL